MVERLTPADLAFFYLEGRRTPQHVGGLAVFTPPPSGFDYDRLVRLLEARIALVPRYRQRIRTVPGHLSNPVWVDDLNFDITYHVRRSALPAPGTEGQLLDFVSRIQSRLLDRSRPLWEMYLVEGLAGGRVAIVTKTHHSLVDGVHSVDLAQVILDDQPEPRPSDGGLWMPAPEPSALQLVGEAVGGLLRQPASVVESVRYGVRDAVRGVRRAVAEPTTVGARLPGHAVLQTGLQAVSGVLGVVQSAAGTAGAIVSGPPSSPLQVRVGEQRRIAIARTRLADYRTVRRANQSTVNDVILAVVTGALRGWLMLRGETVGHSAVLRALVPLTVSGGADGDPQERRVVASLVDLPIGEPDPLLRLSRLRFAMAGRVAAGGVGADALIGLSGYSPPTMHALGARAAQSLTARTHNITITNSPGAQAPRYAAGARMEEIFPILPLTADKAASVGVSSYNGGVFYGFNGDREAMSDLQALADLVPDALAELVEQSGAGAALRVLPDRGHEGREH